MFQAGEEEGHCLVKIVSAQNENLFTYAYIHPFPFFLHHHDVQNHTYMHKYTSCICIQHNALARGDTSMYKCDHHIIASCVYTCVCACIYIYISLNVCSNNTINTTHAIDAHSWICVHICVCISWCIYVGGRKGREGGRDWWQWWQE